MKRYFLFFGQEYYPSYGMQDLVGDFDSVDECIESLKNTIIEHANKESYDGDEIQDFMNRRYATVFDSNTREEYEINLFNVKLEDVGMNRDLRLSDV